MPIGGRGREAGRTIVFLLGYPAGATARGEEISATLFFFNLWVQYYHDTLSKCTVPFFFFFFFTSYYGLMLQKPCQGIKFSEKSVIQSVTDTPTVNQTVIVKEYIDERDIGLLLIPSGVQHSTFYSSISRYLQ